MKSKLLQRRISKTKDLIHKSRVRIKGLKKRLIQAARNYKEAVDKERILAANHRRVK